MHGGLFTTATLFMALGLSPLKNLLACARTILPAGIQL
jgi:hypothetical protein